MRLGNHIVRFSLGAIPVVGNTATGAIVGLTQDGASLCDAMLTGDVRESDVPDSCSELVQYFQTHGFFADKEPEKTIGIQSAYLHITNSCNLSCVGCYSSDAGRNHACDPSTEQLAHAISLLSELGVQRIVISGGEPFLREDLCALACRAKERGVSEVVVLSNGLFCTPERLAPLVGVVDTVSISFDGASANAHAYIRGAQYYDTLVGAVGNVKAAGIRAHILPTLHARNVDDPSAYLALAEKLGVTVGFSLLSGSRESLGNLYPSDVCLEHLADVMHSLGQKTDDDNSFGGIRGGEGLSTHVCCGAGKTGLSVATDGSIYPCHMLHYSELRLGNAFTGNAERICEALAGFCLPKVDELDGCKNCDKRYLCGGGCRARAYAECGSADKTDPYCAYHNAYLSRLFETYL